MTKELQEIIQQCKDEIEFRARQANLKFEKDDIRHLEIDDKHTLVWLMKFANPNYRQEFDGVVDRFVHTLQCDIYWNSEGPSIDIHCIAPFLAMIVKQDGTIIDGRND